MIVKGVLAASLEVSLRVIDVIMRDEICYSFKAKENIPLLKKYFCVCDFVQCRFGLNIRGYDARSYVCRCRRQEL